MLKCTFGKLKCTDRKHSSVQEENTGCRGSGHKLCEDRASFWFCTCTAQPVPGHGETHGQDESRQAPQPGRTPVLNEVTFPSSC